MTLRSDQIVEFREQGLLRVRGVLNPEDLQPVIDEIAEFIDRRALQLHQDGKITDLHTDEPFQRRYGLLFGQSREMGKGLDIMQMLGPRMFNFLHTESLLDTLESLLGREITCNPIQHLRAKPPDEFEPQTGPSFHMAPWHQDAAVMMPEAENSDVITCWMPLLRATPEMGCMEVMPGIVGDGYLRHQKEGGTTIVEELLPQQQATVMDCEQGDIVLMSRFTPHRSRPNLSEHCRWSLDLRYQPTGQHTGRTGHPDFVVRSQDPANRISHDEWKRLWKDAQDNPRGVVGHRAT
ncbi:MAG: mitomycin antibiotic biosynthesis protein [Gemmatimonadetes bacterium]|jgi:hypothetical protein|nr:mitomycin antibiotic biosynthesis protein [Gemmatimonadota bacterium]MBT5058756.1 mitomycin antibiotic biosynthesis protein [Gemmatimonadota bacterium]MBT5144285.1 mitomycin antibiotic biosynthesis protein [Gemmatimonadota bacterium]MBT5588689.1 mitomycin antibiotic biosynthesis protein [Gemmatimonadota bacterium]MBT5964593.1 mitomycin antibiotic biosynthesis protein [Gemmatimonadota bacterium]